MNSTSFECVFNTLTVSNCLCSEGFTGRRRCALAGKVIWLAYLITHLQNFHSEYLPFGMPEGDIVGPREIDDVSDPISLSCPIVFNLQEYRNIFVRYCPLTP